MPQPQTPTQTLTPEEVVFRTNSDSKSLIFVMPDKVVYVGEGAYGGYILKPKELGLERLDENLVSQMISSARAFYVVPEVERLEDLGGYAEIVQRYLNVLPEKVRKAFESSGKELITYKYVEVNAAIRKCSESYAVLDFEPKPNGLKLTAKALRLYLHWQGSRRYPESTTASRILKDWKLEFPDNEVLQKYVYAKNYTGYRGRGSTIYLKIVLEAPRELVSASVAPATSSKKTPIIIKGFLVISRLPSKALLNAALPEIFRNIKIGKKEVRLVMGYFYNKLGTLSRKFYTQILPEHAVNAGFGYIVPKERVSAFLRDVDLLKKEYEEFERQLKDFLLYGRVPPEVRANKRAKVYEEYLDIVMEYLKKHGAEENVREKIEGLRIADRVRVNLLPFSIDYSIVEEFVDEQVKERVNREIEKLSSEIVEAARKRIEERVKRLLERVEKLGAEKLTAGNMESLRNELEGIVREAEEFGIDTEPLRRLSTALENPEEFAKAAMEVRAGSERLRALIKSM